MHPETDTLRAYLQNIEAPEFDTLRLHLAQCETCRNEVRALSALDSFYDSLNPSQQDDILINSTAEDSMPLAGNSDQETLKAALHYAVHSATMQAELGAPETKTPDAKHDSILLRLWQWITRLFELRTPIWAAVPATAVVLAVLAFSLQTFIGNSEPTYSIASYQDNPVMQFRNNDTLPGIGFFSKPGRYSNTYNNVNISMNESGQLNIDWPVVDRAVNYNMRLQLLGKNQKTRIGEVATIKPSATFSIGTPATAQRYEWILSGTTQDKMTFYASGGFVINKTD